MVFSHRRSDDTEARAFGFPQGVGGREFFRYDEGPPLPGGPRCRTRQCWEHARDDPLLRLHLPNPWNRPGSPHFPGFFEHVERCHGVCPGIDAATLSRHAGERY